MGRILPSDPCLIPSSAILPIGVSLLVIVAMVIAFLFICRFCRRNGKSYRDTSTSVIPNPPPTNNPPNQTQTSIQVQNASTQNNTFDVKISPARSPGIRIPGKSSEGNEWYMVNKITPGERNRIPSFDETEPGFVDKNGNPFRAYRTRTPISLLGSRSNSMVQGDLDFD